jgi:Fe-S cluster assembly ATP-binding protein
MILEIKDLHASVGGKSILSGIDLTVRSGEFHVLMGPNGSGKTTLAKAIMGYPGLEIPQGDILVDGNSILKLSPDKRARLGLFLQFQNPIEIDGVGFVNFLKSALESKTEGTVNMREFMEGIKTYSDKLKIDKGVIGRSLNKGFSGGEKKKAEILQMAMLKPEIAILDEPDSGLDIDAIKVVAENINELAERDGTGLLVITHYSRVLKYMKPQFVHVISDGRIVKEGGAELVEELEASGYGQLPNGQMNGERNGEGSE